MSNNTFVMGRADLALWLLISALWGASFLFSRIAAPEFGPLALVFLRALIASAVLGALLLWRGLGGELRRAWKPIAAVGLLNAAIPSLCMAYAAPLIGAGPSAVFGAVTPLVTALIAALWFGERPGGARRVGLMLGLVGVAGLAWQRQGFGAMAGATGSVGLAIAACLLMPLAYAGAGVLSQRHLSRTTPLGAAAGSQLGTAIVLAGPAIAQWPAHGPSAPALWSLAALALLCTGLAYPLFFHLLARVGAARGVTVTFAIPLFALAWGTIFLGERLDAPLLVACAVIVLGCVLAARKDQQTVSPGPPEAPRCPRPRPC
ncbi:MAG: DMT family transporter [Burkholderiales bacterium]|nr:DMT family transporter [Burkholderiales bacterium]